MNEKALKTLEYTKIIDQLTEYASTEMGKQMCRELQPSCDLGTIRQSQTETTDALTRVRMKGSLSFGGVKDVRGSMKRLEIGSSLGIPELLAVSSLLTVAARAQSYGRHEKSEEFPDDSLDERFRALDPLTPVNNVLCFPGLFKGALSVRARDINDKMKLAAAYAIADLITDDDRSEENIIPGAFDPRVAEAVASAVAKAARESGVARL